MENKKPILEFFSEHPKYLYEIIFVLDIDYSKYPYYYLVLVKDINTNYYTTTLVPPELLRYRYKVGNVYKGKKVIGKNKSINTATFTINTNNILQLKQLKDVITKEDFNLVTYEYFNKFYLKQFCYVFELEHFQLIVPSYTIANRFYFLSSSMKKAVYKNSLSSLCENKKFYKDGNTAFIKVKSTAAKRDWPFICRFLENPDSKSRLSYFIHEKSSHNKKMPYGQIKANFPTREEFEIDVSFIQLNNSNRPKLLVLDIFNDSSTFNFTKIHVEKFSSKQGKTSIDISIPIKRRFKKKLPMKINKTIKQGIPSEQFHTKLDGDTALKDRNTEGIEIEIEDIYKISEGEPYTEYSDDIVSPSFENSQAGGSDKLIHSVYSFYGEGSNNGTHIFNINDFYILFELLSHELGVNAINISNLINIKPKKNTKKNISIKYYLNSKKSRNFIYADFYYLDKYIAIIEIELDEFWKAISTWFLISNNIEFQITEEISQDIISHYIGECKTYDELKIFVKTKYNLILYKKAHIKKIDEEHLLSHWVDDVLHDISSISKD